MHPVLCALRPLCIILLLALSACGAPARPGEGPPPSADTETSLPAAGDTVRLGALSGDFHTASRPGAGEQFEMSLYADGARGGRGLRVGVARYGGGRPGVGRHPLGPAPGDRLNPGGRIYATYMPPTEGEEDTTRAFVSVAGELVLAESSARRVAGSFRFTAAEYVARWRPDGRRGSGRPSVVEPGAPRVHVSGTFTAGPFDARAQVVCVGTGGPSVVVEVRDPEGRPAAWGTSVVIEEGAFRDSVDGAHPMDALRVGAGERRPGTYRVRLHRPGYRTAVLEGVRAPPAGDPRCNYAEPADVRRVTLERLPDAPAVRSVVVSPPGLGLGLPDDSLRLDAHVDAAPGVSRALRWSSSDTTVARVSPAGVLRARCRAVPGEAVVRATSVANPGAWGEARVTVLAVQHLSRLEGAPAAEQMADCLRRERAAR